MAQMPLIKKWDDFLSGFRKYSRYLLKYGTAVALIIQVTNGTLFAPEFQLDSILMTVLAWITIGLLLVPHHIATKLGASILLVLFIMVTVKHGIFYMLDYGFYVAIIGVLLVGSTKLENVASRSCIWGQDFHYAGSPLKNGCTQPCRSISSQTIRYLPSALNQQPSSSWPLLLNLWSAICW